MLDVCAEMGRWTAKSKQVKRALRDLKRGHEVEPTTELRDHCVQLIAAYRVLSRRKARLHRYARRAHEYLAWANERALDARTRILRPQRPRMFAPPTDDSGSGDSSSSEGGDGAGDEAESETTETPSGLYAPEVVPWAKLAREVIVVED